jgi:hypothetical protein
MTLLAACDDLESISTGKSDLPVGTGGLYVLCDGNFSLNNSTLGVYNYSQSTYTPDFFQQRNGRKLGDTGNDLQRYGSKLYVVVNGSSQLEVLDARTGASLRRIPLFNGAVPRQPRSVTFWEDKAYVCAFDGSVARIDTAALTVEAYARAGRNPDGIAASNGKLYVSNSGGLDYQSEVGYDRTVSVIPVSSFTEERRIDVGLNPGCIRADDFGHVWVVVRGDYGVVPSTWVRIDATTDAVTARYDLSVTNVSFAGTNAYFYVWNEAEKRHSVGVFDLRLGTLITPQFITDGTPLKTPYGIYADAEQGKVFLTDAYDYVSSGDVLCFSTEGKLLYRLKDVGINPNTALPVADFHPGTVAPSDSVVPDTTRLYRVLEYTPAPGQFVGVYPVFAAGDTKESLRQKAEKALKGTTGGLVSLGRWGGSLTFAFQTPVHNGEGMDFRVFGNAFVNASEPGIVEVSEDVNRNGLADDPWYELAGSEYHSASTRHRYRITYYKPSSPADSVRFRDFSGAEGKVNAFYPPWEADSLTVEGSLLAPTAQPTPTGYWMLTGLAWGYADNVANTSENTGFDLDWAVDENGHGVSLSRIHFVRVYTGVNQTMGRLGELSTELTGALNLHP